MNLYSHKAKRFIALGFGILSMYGAAACGSGGGAINQVYQGTITDNEGRVGTVQFNLNTSQTSDNVTGTLNPNDGDNVTLDGDMNNAGIVNASGGGYSFTGLVANGFMTGVMTGPDSSDGVFTTLDASHSITEYCGVFTGTDSGVWSLEISSNDNVAGSSAVLNSTASTVYTGNISGNTLTLSSVNGSDATGTLSGNTVQGTWTGTGEASGTFTVSSEGCD